jgi:hypothetical protein
MLASRSLGRSSLYTPSTVSASHSRQRAPGGSSCAIRLSVGCALIIRLIIQTILLYPSRAIWTDEAPNVSRLDPSGAVQFDAEHPTRDRKVEGSRPSLAPRRRRYSGAFGMTTHRIR